MKRVLVLLCCFFALGMISASHMGYCQSTDEVFQQFGQKYDSLKPPAPGSSVSSDYKLEQTALGTYYTTKMLNVISRQNQEMISRYQEMLKKYDQIISQNEKMIELLSVLTKK